MAVSSTLVRADGRLSRAIAHDQSRLDQAGRKCEGGPRHFGHIRRGLRDSRPRTSLRPPANYYVATLATHSLHASGPCEKGVNFLPGVTRLTAVLAPMAADGEANSRAAMARPLISAVAAQYRLENP